VGSTLAFRTQPISETAELQRIHFAGLDTIRFLCAFWVVLYHFRVPEAGLFFNTATTMGGIAATVYDCSFKGQPAVIIFFIISGFCIHYPYSINNALPSLPAYFARRYIRIAGPLLPAIWLATTLLDVRLSLFDRTVLWSLLAELIYYGLYPGILWIRRLGVSWFEMILMTIAIGLVLITSNPLMPSLPMWGPYAAWLLGLPPWLMGCQLAEHVRRHGIGVAVASIWAWRIGVFLLALVCNYARYYLQIGYPWTLTLFAAAASVWLLMELHHFQHRRPLAALEWAGAWSYSLYLFHIPAIAMTAFLPAANAGFRTTWLYQFLFILCVSFIFAVTIEFPFHSIARATSRWIAKVRSSASKQLVNPQ
jgi:peptidoglycan/LPS O-acetylase OafA/YrhL